MLPIYTLDQQTFVRCKHCSQCYDALSISKHLERCLSATYVEVPYSKLSVDEFKLLKEARLDADRQIVVIKMVKA